MSNSNSKKSTAKRKIKKALISLMKEMPYDRISISSICKKADICRSSFYSNYFNKDEVIDDLLDDCNKQYILNYPKVLGKSRIEQSCFWLEMIKSGEMLVPIINNNINDLTKIARHFESSEETDELMKKSVLALLSEHRIHMDEKIVYSLFSSIIGSVISQWISSGFDTPTIEIARLICTLIGFDDV